MRMIDLIAHKRDGMTHSPAEIAYLASCAAQGSAPDYQLSAWLMAAYQRGLDTAETVKLTRAMSRSGRRLDFSALGRPVVDKHSTGGVGDGLSLALAPLAAEAGVAVPMMSGRGLGHTGGTLDKLESIRGFNVRLSPSAIAKQMRSIGVCMFGQSEDLVPADRRLYALRDATATVESIPLIVASILSKKISEDLDALVLDVKCGSGAFMAERGRARELARALVATSRRLGLRSVALVTDMSQPLGWAVGPSLELRQAIEVLKGDRASTDYRNLLLRLGGWMLRLAGRARSWEEGARTMEMLIGNGRALGRLRRMIHAQGGDERVVDDPQRYLPEARLKRAVRARRGGYVQRLDARTVGRASVVLGAGRDRMEDRIDFGAGIWLRRKVGDRVRPGEEIATLFAGDAGRLKEGDRTFAGAWSVGPARPRPIPLVHEVIQ